MNICVLQVWSFTKAVPCTTCSCVGEPLTFSGTFRTTIKVATWTTHTVHIATCGCLSHTRIQCRTRTRRPPDWSRRLGAPFISSPCAWTWPLTSPRRSKAQASLSLESRQSDLKWTHSGTNPLSLHRPVMGDGSALGGALLEKHFKRYTNWVKYSVVLCCIEQLKWVFWSFITNSASAYKAHTHSICEIILLLDKWMFVENQLWFCVQVFHCAWF